MNLIVYKDFCCDLDKIILICKHQEEIDGKEKSYQIAFEEGWHAIVYEETANFILQEINKYYGRDWFYNK